MLTKSSNLAVKKSIASVSVVVAKSLVARWIAGVGAHSFASMHFVCAQRIGNLSVDF